MKLFEDKIKISVLLITICFLINGCNSKEENNIDVSHINVEVDTRRLEKEVFSLSSKEEIKKFLRKNPTISQQYFNLGKRFNEEEVTRNINQLISLPYNDTLYNEIAEKIFVDFSKYEEEIKKGFQYLKHYYPEYKIPKICTMISGFSNFGFGGDIIFTDSLIVIGLDYFGGNKLRYRPPEVPTYILDRYQPEYISTTIFTLLSSKFNNYDNKDNVLLSDIIYYGKAYFFTKKLLPFKADSLIVGYSGQEMADVSYNEKKIWSHFVDNKLFFETNDFIKNKYVGERPKVLEISSYCPGRIGRWLGWKIIDAYAKNNTGKELKGIMKNPSARKLFQESKYKPGFKE